MSRESEIGLLRLVAQRVAGPRAATPAEAVRRLTAVQGQDHPGSVTAVALRTAGRSRADVLAAMDRGEIVRSWPMRGTLHLTLAEDLPWMLDLLGERALAGVAKRRALLELTDDDVARACEAAVAALSGGRRLYRAGLLLDEWAPAPGWGARRRRASSRPASSPVTGRPPCRTSPAGRG